MDQFHDESGLFAVAGHREAAHRTAMGMVGLTHRGAERAVIAASDGVLVRRTGARGTADELFSGPDLGELRGRIAVGQVSGHRSTRMVFGRTVLGQLAVAFAGRFANTAALREELKQRGTFLHDGSDAEVLAQLIARSGKGTLINRLVDALWQVKGAYAAVVCTEDKLVAVRDPRGFRPMFLGELGKAAVFSTEDAAIRLAGGRVRREVQPGEMVIVDVAGTVLKVAPFGSREQSACIHELVSLASNDASLWDSPVYGLRVALGERLAREQPCMSGEVVIGLPGRSSAQAVGYARGAELPFREGLLAVQDPRENVSEPSSGRPYFRTLLRYRPIPGVLADRPVVLVVPSLVTGDEIGQLCGLIRESAAREVHVRVASPPVHYPCPYGIQSPSREEMLAPRIHSLVDLSRKLGAESVGFLSHDGFHDIAGRRVDGERTFCDACFSGDHPVPLEGEDLNQLPLFDLEAEG